MRKVSGSRHDVAQRLTDRRPLHELCDCSDVSRPSIVGKKIENGLALGLNQDSSPINRTLPVTLARVVFVARPKSACAVSRKRKDARVESRININKSRNEEKRLTQRELYGSALQ